MNYTNKLIGCRCRYCRGKADPLKAIALTTMIAGLVGLVLLWSR